MKKTLSLETIERWLKDSDCDVRMVAANACQTKNIPLDVIKRWIQDSNCYVRMAAIIACNGKDVPFDVIECGLQDSECEIRAAAINVCNGRDIPLDTIERWLKSSNWCVREAAINACKNLGIEVPLIRTIEPPNRVYKKCLGDVIVIAEIPKDAQIRGTKSGKCRADKAKIVDIIGDFGGEKVGISCYDRTTTYFVGDEVYIEDFDMSKAEPLM